MNPATPGDAAGGARERALAAFIARIGERFDHDLRSELGTILNLASIQEVVEAGDVETVRDFAAQIRAHAQEVANLWKMIEEALALATGERRLARGDPAAAVRAAASECRVALAESPSPAARGAAAAPVDHDPRVVAFAARAFLRLMSAARPSGSTTARVEVRRDAGAATIVIDCTAATPVVEPAAAGVAAFLRAGDVNAGRVWRSALHAAAALLELQGGSLDLAGSPTGNATLSLRLPPAR